MLEVELTLRNGKMVDEYYRIPKHARYIASEMKWFVNEVMGISDAEATVRFGERGNLAVISMGYVRVEIPKPEYAKIIYITESPRRLRKLNPDAREYIVREINRTLDLAWYMCRVLRDMGYELCMVEVREIYRKYIK